MHGKKEKLADEGEGKNFGAFSNRWVLIFGDLKCQLKGSCFRDTDRQVAYPMHSACYDLLQQEFLRITTGPALDPTALGTFFKSQELDPCGRRFRPEWSDVGYAGAEHFWQNSLAWMEHLDTDAQVNRALEWDFLVCDPGTVRGLDDLLASPLLVTESEESQTSSVHAAGILPGTDTFAVLHTCWKYT
jgi:hypothetical protein